MQHQPGRHTLRGMILILAVRVAGGTLPAEQPVPQTTPLDPVVDRILTRLEKRHVQDLKARVKWELTYAIEEDEDSDRKVGTLWYRDAEPVAKFKVHFDRKLVENTSRELNEQHLFDGCWYTELQAQTKTITRRQIRRADEPSNPYRLGEGAFPLPFGQKKADILAEFDVSRVEPKTGDPPATDHLRLVPRPNTNTGRTYKTLDFWVAQEGPNAGLPVKVMAGKKDGTGQVNSYITITFSDIELNTGLSDAVFKIEQPAGYEVIEEPLEPAGTPGAQAPGDSGPR